MKKQTIIIIVFILGLIIGFSVLLYPTIGEYFNSISQSRAVAYYLDDVAAMDNGKMRAILEAAYEYNENLLHKQDRFTFTEADTTEYKKQLNSGRGVMGILSIDKVDIQLPIYHGTDQGVLQAGIGHMQGTSLPVGGIGTHAFITGHRGVPSSKLLTDLNKMEKGDTFMLYVMGDILTYKVDEIQTVEPHEVRALDIDPDMDYCTLVTCTPYGVNTHRLLVRGRRIENAAAPGWEAVYAGAKWLDQTIVILIFLVPVILFLILYVMFDIRKIHKGGLQR
jgi:sortase A